MERNVILLGQPERLDCRQIIIFKCVQIQICVVLVEFLASHKQLNPPFLNPS